MRKKYNEFKKPIVDDVSRNISEQQIIQIVDQINEIFKIEGVPTGNENIIPALKATLFKNEIGHFAIQGEILRRKALNTANSILNFSLITG
jgi:hypothetical protein